MEQSGKIAPEGIIPRRSPRLTSTEETPQVPALVSSTSMRGQGQISGALPPHRVSAGDIEIAIEAIDVGDQSSRHRSSSGVRQSLGTLPKRPISQIVRREVRADESPSFFDHWTYMSKELEARARMLRRSDWRPIFEIKANKIVETWVYYEPTKTTWQSISVDGAVDQMDEFRLQALAGRYLTNRDEIDEVYMFPDETVANILHYLEGRRIDEIVATWGPVSNPVSDFIKADFKCATCKKVRKLRYLHARQVLSCIPPDKRSCEALGKRCSDVATQKAYHPPLKVLEQCIAGTARGREAEDQDEYGSVQSPPNPDIQHEGPSEATHFVPGRMIGEDIHHVKREEAMGENALAVLKSMGRQGMSVKPYDGKGGGTALRVWGESLRRHFRLFNITEPTDQLVLATCCLEGKAKDWWDGICLTEQWEEINNLEQLLHVLQLHFRPLNEDISQALQWRTLQQSGDVNSYRQHVYQLRAQFPFGEAAEFWLTFHGMKKELRTPVVAELWKMNTRFLSLTQLFELAAQAEVTSIGALFPRFSERPRIEHPNQRNQWNNRSQPWGTGGTRSSNFEQRSYNQWQPRYRSPPNPQQTWGDKNRHRTEARNSPKPVVKRTEDQSAWMKKRPCWICDKTGHLIRDCNKRKTSGCPRCGKDHQLRVCPDRPKTTIACVEVRKGGKKDSLLDSVQKLTPQIDQRSLLYKVLVNGLEAVVMVDTGAQLSLISVEEAERLGVSCDTGQVRKDVVTADGRKLEVVGAAMVTFEYERKKHREMLWVAQPLQHPIILGLPWLRKHAPCVNWNDLSLTFASGEVWEPNVCDQYHKGLVRQRLHKLPLESNFEECLLVAVTKTMAEGEYNTKVKREFLVNPAIQPLLQTFEDIFEPLSGVPPEDRIQHCIDLVPNAKPVMKRPYRLAEAQLAEVAKQIEGALKEGWVQPSFSPWGTAIFVVGKKNGEWRMCVDYRDLNALTEQDAYPLPRIDDILHKVAAAKVFTTLDLQSGCHQIQIRPKDRPKTAFRLAKPVKGSCHYEWKVMPFGLKNAPPTFQRYMSLVLKDCVGFCEVYMDDIIIYSNSMEEHLEHVRQVFQTLREAQLKVKIEKCTFGQESVEFLGHVLKGGRIWMRPEKQQVISNWHEPLKTAKEVRQFLGLASYYRNYVANFATTAAPLIALTRKRSTITWSWEVQQAFHALKQVLSKNIGRVCWTSQLPVRVTTDASGVGLGAVLEQQHGDVWETVAVWSRALNSCQRNYSILDKEWLAILEAVTRVWRHWLVGIQFEIHTDHAPLVQILTKKVEELTPRQLRWLERLEPFSFSIKFIRGRENTVADALSREVQVMEVNAVEVIGSDSLQFGIDDVREGVKTDPFYQEMVDDESVRLQLGLIAEGGLLYTEDGQLCIPDDRALRFKLVLEHHDQVFSGHWSEEKTLSQLKRGYFWPSMRQDVQEVVDTCEVCQRSRFQKKTDRAPIRFLEAQYPWEVVTVDFVSGFATTRRKHTAICVMCDRFTRMMHAEPCKDHATAKETARILLRRVFSQHGCPRVLVSDRGAQFDSELWRQLWGMLGTRVHLATTHHPQSNGLTERMNRTLITLIKKVTQLKKHEWEELLPLLEFAYNQTPNATTGVAPFEAQQGYLPEIPSTLLVAVQNRRFKAGSVEEFVESVRREFRRIHEIIRTTEAQVQQGVEIRENSRRKAPEFFVGDEVLVYWEPFLTYSTQPRKQRLRYQGPFRVIEVKHPHCVRLEGLPERMPDLINVEYVHLYKRSQQLELTTLRNNGANGTADE